MKIGVVLLHGQGSAALTRAWRARLGDVEAAGVSIVEASASDCAAQVQRAFRDARPEYLVIASPDLGDIADLSRECASALGIDGLNVETIQPSAIRLLTRSEEDAPLLVRGALADAQDARSLAPAHRRLDSGIAGKRVSRRALLFGLFTPTPSLIPLVDAARCKASQGCSLCIWACPVDALSTPRGSCAKLAPEACVACGLCVAACPAAAISFPSLDARMFAARVRAMLDPGPPGVFTIIIGSSSALEEAASAQEPQPEKGGARLPIVAPCAGALPPSFLVHALRAGARGVVLLPCPQGVACAAKCATMVTRTVDSARAALRLVGRPLASLQAASDAAGLSVALSRLEDQPTAMPLPEGPPRGLGHEARALLAQVDDGRDITDVPGTPCGLPILAPDACTLCGLCASVCPTGALRMDECPAQTRLERRHADCNACALCVKICPEGALSLSPGLHAVPLREEFTVLSSAKRGSCRSCGADLPPQPLLDLVVARTTLNKTTRQWLDFCPSCRILSDPGAKGGVTG